MSDQGLRPGAQRSQQHLLHLVLSKAQQEGGPDVSRSILRTASPHLDADIASLQGPDVLLSSTPTSGRGGLDTEYPGGNEDRKHMPDRSQWSLMGGTSAVGSPATLSGDSMVAWGQSTLEGAPTALLGQQASFEDHTRDTEIDAPMAHLNLHNLQATEGLVGSWPGAARHGATADAALPFFQGRPIRTSGSNLAHMAHNVQRTSSFTGHPGSARASMGGLGPESSFAGTDQIFGSSNSAPITPRSPGFGYQEEDAHMPLPNVSAGPPNMSRHGPSKLRMSSSDAGGPPPLPAVSAAVAAGGLQGFPGLDALGRGFQGCGPADLQMALQQQAAMLAQQPNLMPSGPVLPQQAQAAAMAQTAALMANMSQDPTAAAAALSAFNPMLGGAMLPDAAAGVNNMQMQMLMYYAQLGMMTQINSSNSNMGMGMQGAGPLPHIANNMMFPMLTPQQMAASLAAAQQQWQAGMPASAIANIAAAAAVAATAASAPEELGPGNRNNSRTRGVMLDKAPDRRLRCDKGGRGSTGRLDDALGSPVVQRMDPLLEEYKNNRTRRWEMRDILGHMLEFSLDQLGSRFIQQKLDTLLPEELEAAFAEIAPKGVMLMNDVFGNYVIQKFLELEVEGPRQELAQQMKGQVLSLSLQLYSCRVIQKALEVLPLEQKIGMVAELDGALMRCVRDQNGNHVIQKVIECVPTEHITNLLDTFSGSLVSLSQHPFGCRVMQRILEHCTDQQRYNSFMTEILKATVQLAQDQYGNYVIQHVVERGKPHERDAVYDRLFPHIVVLSQNKFASNVVEKMLLHCTPQQRGAIVEEFLKQPSRRLSSDGVVAAAMTNDEALRACEQSALEQMMQDQYGNYVVQKTLEVCDEGQRERLLSRVRSYYEILKTSQFGKHIVNRLEKLLSAGMRIQVNNLSNSPTMLNATLPVDQQQPASAADVDTVPTAAAALTTAATGEGVVQSS